MDILDQKDSQKNIETEKLNEVVVNESVNAKNEDNTPVVETENYSLLSEEDLVNKAKEIVKDQISYSEIKGAIDSIKLAFYKKHKQYQEEEKKKFIEDGGIEEDYAPKTSLLEEEFKAILADYKEKRNAGRGRKAK